MRFPRRIAVLFLAHGLLLTPPAAQAGKPRGEPGLAPAYRVAPRPHGVGCMLGQPGPGTGTSRWICAPDDRYFTLFVPDSCTDTCMGRNTALIKMAHMRLFFSAACTLKVATSIVGVTGTESCSQPDESNLLCSTGDTTTIVAGPADVNQVREFTFTFPETCKVVGRAFLCFDFNSISPDGCAGGNEPPFFRPAVVAQFVYHQCANCNSWNYYSFAPTQTVDLCSLDPNNPGIPGSPDMWVDVAKCSTTPTRRTTWGQLKAIYR